MCNIEKKMSQSKRIRALREVRSGTPLVRMAKGDFSCARMTKGDLDYLLHMLAPVAFEPESSSSARVSAQNIFNVYR